MSWTYTTLKSAIQDYTQNTETTFVSNLAVIITQAEQRIIKSVELPNFRKNVTGVLTTGNQYLSTPSDYLYPYSLAVLDINNNYTYLLNTDVSFIREAYPVARSATTTYTVTVASGVNIYGSGNKYYLNGINSPTLKLTEGQTYRFDQSDSSNSGHPLRFSITSNGTWGEGTEYTTGVTTTGTPGSVGAYTEITVAVDAPTLYYYCTNHTGMGGQADTLVGPVTEIPKHYAQFDDNTFIVGPTPNANLTAELHYFYIPQSISASSDGTSWLGTNAPELLLYGSLLEAYTFMKGEPDVMINYEKRFQEALQRLTLESDGYNRKDAYRDGQRKINV